MELSLVALDKGIGMFRMVLIVSLYAFCAFGMEIDDASPLIRTLASRYDRDLEAQRQSKMKAGHHSSLYLERLPIDVAHHLTHFVDAGSPALILLLERISPDQKQATALYKRILAANTEFTNVAHVVENIENEKTRQKFRLALQPHQTMIARITKKFRENEIGEVRQLLEAELGNLDTLRSVTFLTRNSPVSNRIRRKIAYYRQIFADLNGAQQEIDEKREFAEKYVETLISPSNGYCICIAISTLAVIGALGLYGLITMMNNGFYYNFCFGTYANNCLKTPKEFNCSHHEAPYNDSFVCCKNYGYNTCTRLQEQYNASHTAIDPWLPLIIGSSILISLNALIQLVGRTCLRAPVLSPELSALVKEYEREIVRVKPILTAPFHSQFA